MGVIFMKSTMKNIANVLLASGLISGLSGCSRDNKGIDRGTTLDTVPDMVEERYEPAVSYSVDEISSMLTSGISPSELVSNQNVSYSDLSAFVRDAYNSDDLGPGQIYKVSAPQWQMIIDRANTALTVLNDDSIKPELDRNARTLHADLYLQAARGKSRLIQTSKCLDELHDYLFQALLNCEDDALRGGFDQAVKNDVMQMLSSLSYQRGTTRSFQDTLNNYSVEQRNTLMTHFDQLPARAKRNYQINID
jgi:hypothetical protein